MGLWLMGALIVGSVYRSNLKAMLTLPKLRLPFDSLDDLVKTDIPTYITEGSMLHQALMNAPADTSLAQLRKQAIVGNDFIKITVPVSKGEYAVCMGRQALQAVIHGIFRMTHSCPLYIARESFFRSTGLAFAFPKGSPLRDKVNSM
ncbi:uncharacterized protein [Penaeus vannamei]|uniref:uncharacterized protein n=1 Tax=Penaeus vannamei TaxID=6689 RepID=UPI00387F7820